MMKCSYFGDINTLNLALSQKLNIAVMYDTKTIKLRTKSKLYEQKCNHMVLAM